MPLGVIGAVALGTGVLAAGASIYATTQQGKIASSQRGMADTIFNEQQSFEQQLQKLIADPSSVTKLPGYQFQLQQGEQSVARQMGASGFAGSGNEAAALTQYGQGFAQNFYLAQANLLSSLAGITAPSSPAQAGAVASGSSANQFNQFANLAAGFSSLAGYYGSSGSPGAPPPSSDTSSTALMPAGQGSQYLLNVPGTQ